MKTAFTLLLLASLLTNCQSAATEAAMAGVEQTRSNSTVVSNTLVEINLAAIGRIAPKGRVQDRDYNQNPIIDRLLEHGKESIPYLISKLDDEARIERHIVDYWSQVSVGDVALIVLTDFFTDSGRRRTTIPGVGWDEFLGGGENPALTGEQRLRDYIAKHGRKSLQTRWQHIWEENKGRIYWDEAERCFKVAAP